MLRHPAWPEYYRGSNGVFLLFLGYVLWWYLDGNYRFPLLGTIRFEFVIGTILTVLAIPGYFGNPHRKPSGLAIWVTLLFLTMVPMVLFSFVPETSWVVFVDRVVKFALFGAFIAAFVTTPRRLAWFVGIFLFACLRMDFEGVVGAISGGLIWENQGVLRLHGPTPKYSHPNSFAGMALGTLPFIIYFFRLAPFYLRVALLVQLVLSIFVILYTGSRTGYVGLFLGLVALVLRSRRRLRALVLLAGILLVTAPFVPRDYVERAETIFTLKEKEGHSAEARRLILTDGWEILMRHPLGVGVYGFRAARIKYFDRDEDPHNLFLEVASNLGFQGLLVFVCLLGALLRYLVRLGRNFRDQVAGLDSVGETGAETAKMKSERAEHLSDLRILEACCQAVFLFVIIRVVLGLFGHDLYEIYWWFAMGLAVAIGNMNLVAEWRTKVIRAKFLGDATPGNTA